MSDKPSPLRKDDYSQLLSVLPKGAVIIGVLPPSVFKEQPEHVSSVVCIYTLDDHTIQRATIGGSMTDLRIEKTVFMGVGARMPG